jgi:hypothetical protein
VTQPFSLYLNLMSRSITPVNLTVVFILKWAFFGFCCQIRHTSCFTNIPCNWMGIKFILKDHRHVHRRLYWDIFGNMILRWLFRPVGFLLHISLLLHNLHVWANFNPSWHKSSLGIREFKIVKMKGSHLTQGEIIEKEW